MPKVRGCCIGFVRSRVKRDWELTRQEWYDRKVRQYEHRNRCIQWAFKKLGIEREPVGIVPDMRVHRQIIENCIKLHVIPLRVLLEYPDIDGRTAKDGVIYRDGHIYWQYGCIKFPQDKIHDATAIDAAIHDFCVDAKRKQAACKRAERNTCSQDC